MKPVVLSGIQPSGHLHVGNYLGAVKHWVELQNSGRYQCFFCIVDYHSLTGAVASRERLEQIWTLAAELLALGLDPAKSTLFIQSEVPEATELSWIFAAVTPIAELYRMTQFKDKSGASASLAELETELALAGDGKGSFSRKLGEDILNFFRTLNKNNVGLLTYPVLQAADILLYRANFVPVGQDQVQHVELTRDIARWFNKRYGLAAVKENGETHRASNKVSNKDGKGYFPETKVLLTSVPKVMSLLAPEKKMSKSHGAASVIELADEPEIIARKLKKAVTATVNGGNQARVESMAPGVANLFTLLECFGPAGLCRQFRAAERDGSIRYSDLKQVVAEAVAAHFAEFRERRRELLAHPQQVREAFASGCERARAVASATMADVRRLVGVR